MELSFEEGRLAKKEFLHYQYLHMKKFAEWIFYGRVVSKYILFFLRKCELKTYGFCKKNYCSVGYKFFAEKVS